MKKILCLALALMMTLTAGLALAEEKFDTIPSSITNVDIEGVEVTDENGNPVASPIVLALHHVNNPGVNELLAQMGALQAAGGNPVGALPEEALALLPVGHNFTQVNEALDLFASGGVYTGNSVNVNLDLQTNYEDKTIAVLLGRIVDGYVDSWKLGTAEVVNGKIHVIMTQTLINWLNDNEMLVLVLS